MKYIKKINKILFLLSFVSLLIVSFYLFPLPEHTEIIPHIKDLSPVIEPIKKEPYKTDFDGVTYKITPLYSYEAYGVIVEHYDSDNWLDVIHEGDPAQTKDICIVWGENIKNDIYRKVKYSHGEFTCFVETDSREVWQQFNQNELTNNHLIPANDELEKLLKKTKIGDQVYIKGMLVNYEILDEDGNKVRWRTTSSTMEDRDCEVVFVEDYEIIKSRHPLIKNARQYSFWGLGLSTLIGGILFLFT